MVKALANFEYETFNAAGGTVTLRGVSVHTGTAKGIMINCAKLAMQFDALLPGAAVPEHMRSPRFLYAHEHGNSSRYW